MSTEMSQQKRCRFFDRIINDGIRASTLGHRFDALTNEKTITVASGALTLPPLFQKMNFICEDISWLPQRFVLPSGTTC